MEQIILHGISASDFYNRFDKLEKQIESLLKLNGQSKSLEPESEYLTRKQVALVLKISLPTLNTWTKEGKLLSYRIGTRILYRKEEVNKALIQIQFKSMKGNYGA